MEALIDLIDQEHESRQGRPRGHLGGSLLGHPCERWLWLSFRWAVQEQFPGRVLRLFRRGHNEEDLIIRDLRAVGAVVIHTQRKVLFGGHVAGSIDGVAKNVPDQPPTKEYLLEFKTHARKSFEHLEKHGVEKSKFQHFVQMQAYMHGANFQQAIYIAVCKDDDRMHIEAVEYDKQTAEKYIKRGQDITLMERMPPPISTDPTWYQCKFCPAYDLCHAAKPTKHANCRTCAHVTPTQKGEWHCGVYDSTIPEDFQHDGCDSHVIHPDLVPWEMKPRDDGRHVEWVIGDRVVLNGPDGVKSREILANPDFVGTDLHEQVKAMFPEAEVIANAS